MDTDFRKAVREMRAEEQRLERELLVIRQTLPGLELMASRMPPEANSRAVRYASMGTKQAILHLLTEENGNSLTAQQLADTLLAGGIPTTSKDYVRSVSTTLSQMGTDGLVERVEDRWKIAPKRPQSPDATASERPTVQ